MRLIEGANVIKDVRASVCNVRAFRALSRYVGISFIGTTAEDSGVNHSRAQAGSNAAGLGVLGREFGGVAR